MPGSEERGDSWLWKGAVGALFTFVAAVSVKGCDNWDRTNDVLSRLDERAKARELWDRNQDDRLQRMEKALETFIAGFEDRAGHAREAIEDLQRSVRQLQEAERHR